jgi:predicted transcriptional regulator
LRNRDTTIIYWELLRTMASEPQLPSRLARVVNVPYNRLGNYLQLLTDGGLARVESTEGHEKYYITPRGMDALNHLDSGLKMLFQALG